MSPLVFLVRADLLEILREGTSEVVVPVAVLRELEAHGYDDPTVRAIRSVDWITAIAEPEIAPEIAAWDLGPGESAVLSLAKSEPAAWAVIDDGEARRCARSLGIHVIGTLGLVLLAKRVGRITLARPVVDQLRASGMYLSDVVMNLALERVGE
jgi:predicted nucleic acid-binding protein